MTEYTEQEEFSRQIGLVRWLMCVDESLGWHERVVLDSFKVQRRPHGWLLVIQAHRVVRKDQLEHVVCFVDGASLAECMNGFARQVRHRQVRWQSDRYPPNMGD